MKKRSAASQIALPSFKLLAVSAFTTLGLVGLMQPAFAVAPKDTLVIGKSADPQTLDPAVTI